MKLDKTRKLFQYIASIPRSLYINLRLLPLKDALLIPILVSNKTRLGSLVGAVHLDKIKPGIVRIGFGGTDMVDYHTDRGLLKVTGEIYFQGKAKIATGAKLIIDGTLSLGENFAITGDTTIICAKSITIGSNTMLAWQTIVMDTDQHTIYDHNKQIINPDKPIVIGNNVWVGARCFILKGAHIPDGSIVGANTTLSKSYQKTKTIIAGNPPRILKEDISWDH